MIVIDEKKIFDEIQRLKPVSIALNGPDGILPQVQAVSEKIMARFGIPAYVLADTTWGTCDLNSNGAKILGAEILFNIGHSIKMQIQDDVILVDAFDNIEFDSVAEKCVDELKGKTVSLITDSQHLHEVEKVREILTRGGVYVKIGKGKGQLNDGQVFGCEFYPAMELREEVDVNVFLGQSNFHAAGIALSTNIPTYVLDPYFNEVREVTEFARWIKFTTKNLYII